MKRFRWKFNYSTSQRQSLQHSLIALEDQFSHYIYLDSNQHSDRYGKFDWLCAWNAETELNSRSQSFSKLQKFWEQHRDWCFGHLSFNLKNEVENLNTRQPDRFDYPHLSFFIPSTVVFSRNGELHCESTVFKSQKDFESSIENEVHFKAEKSPHFEYSLSRNKYLEKIAGLKEELQYGNIYEINFCMALDSEQPLHPVNLFYHLNQRHHAPFTAFYRLGPRHLLCFSPERYLQKTGETLISQPIKGTAARAANQKDDEARIAHLKQSEKERAENVMIVDLVRNDLSRTAQKGSVTVPELFGVYTYNAVHQMISTIESKLDAKYSFSDVLATTFPMGSMTGAPKISALNLIDQYEDFNRSLYSGSVGYITPQGDFDFNVVIRSILYHQQEQHASIRVGSAITIHCDAQQEYEECLLKAEKLLD